MDKITLPVGTKNLSNMKVMSTPIVVGAFGTILKGFANGLINLKMKRQMETEEEKNLSMNKSISLLRSARILKKVQKTGGS